MREPGAQSEGGEGGGGGGGDAGKPRDTRHGDWPGRLDPGDPAQRPGAPHQLLEQLGHLVTVSQLHSSEADKSIKSLKTHYVTIHKI